MAIACLGLVTFFPDPLFNLPCFIAFISRSTLLEAFGLYLREELDFLVADFLRLPDAEDLEARFAGMAFSFRLGSAAGFSGCKSATPAHRRQHSLESADKVQTCRHGKSPPMQRAFASNLW